MDKNGITITIGAPNEVGTEIGGKSIAKYGVGKKCRGRVVNFKPYGFFVETEDGGFGLVHGRNVNGWKWGDRFDRVFRHGSEIEVTVVDIEEGTNRMSFSCEMPADVEPEEEPRQIEPTQTQISRQEVAQKWAEDNPDSSASAYEWLKKELEDGPIYGPLTTVLCDRFGVPVPASRWILLFDEFTCYSGHGDNPSDLPAVALSSHAGEVAYWNRIKVRSEELIENRNRTEDDTERFGKLAKRLDGMTAFPGSKWISEYKSMTKGLVRGKGIYGVSDTVERLAIPMLGQLGWDVSPENAALVRGSSSTFDIRLYSGAATNANISIAVKCSPAGTPFSTLRGSENPVGIASRDMVEQVLSLYNQLGSVDSSVVKVVWTDGIEWVVFTRELLSECIGVIAEHRGVKLMEELSGSDVGSRFRRVTFPSDGGAFNWLAAFAELSDLIGNSKA